MYVHELNLLFHREIGYAPHDDVWYERWTIPVNMKAPRGSLGAFAKAFIEKYCGDWQDARGGWKISAQFDLEWLT